MRGLVVIAPVLSVCAAIVVWIATRTPDAPLMHTSSDAAAINPANGAPLQQAAGAEGANASAAAAHATNAATPSTSAAKPAANGAPRGAATTTAAAGVMWPVAGKSGSRSSANAPSADGTVPVRLAFWSLWYLGVDPAAEKTWARAINDPAQPAGVRSDLIVDMVDEGYTDNDRPGLEDLALIRTRLEILERHWPHAIDDVNAKAFEEAYRTLLEIYTSLGGEARIPPRVR